MLRKLASNFNTVLLNYLPLVIVIVCLSSCIDTRKSIYFNGATDATIQTHTNIPESKIAKNDLLSITVSSLNPEASLIFNPIMPGQGANGLQNGQATALGYLVNPDGFIQFPILGNIKAEGLTKSQLKDKISTSIAEKKLLLDPIVSIRFLNFRVTILGEVGHPAVVTVPNEKISLLEAIGLAGDLTIYAHRDNVMIIREEKDQKIIKRINLNSGDLFTSPYYYLQSNDIVYVEPNRARIASAGRSAQFVPILLSFLSFAAIVANTIKN